MRGLLIANLQLKDTHREPTSVQNVEELLNAKRPLPVTPISGEPAEESIDLGQASLPATPSMTELVSLMEKLQIAPTEDLAPDYVADVSYSHLDDVSNGADRYSSLSYKVWKNKFKFHHLKIPLLIMVLMSLILNQMLTAMVSNMHSSLSYKVWTHKLYR